MSPATSVLPIHCISGFLHDLATGGNVVQTSRLYRGGRKAYEHACYQAYKRHTDRGSAHHTIEPVEFLLRYNEYIRCFGLARVRLNRRGPEIVCSARAIHPRGWSLRGTPVGDGCNNRGASQIRSSILPHDQQSGPQPGERRVQSQGFGIRCGRQLGGTQRGSAFHLNVAVMESDGRVPEQSGWQEGLDSLRLAVLTCRSIPARSLVPGESSPMAQCLANRSGRLQCSSRPRRIALVAWNSLFDGYSPLAARQGETRGPREIFPWCLEFPPAAVQRSTCGGMPSISHGAAAAEGSFHDCGSHGGDPMAIRERLLHDRPGVDWQSFVGSSSLAHEFGYSLLFDHLILVIFLMISCRGVVHFAVHRSRLVRFRGRIVFLASESDYSGHAVATPGAECSVQFMLATLLRRMALPRLTGFRHVVPAPFTIGSRHLICTAVFLPSINFSSRCFPLGHFAATHVSNPLRLNRALVLQSAIVLVPAAFGVVFAPRP
ncbi:hypothetical protein R1flu_010092 [Riccia fluitans]|uniref:Uncharacterized protein n=1 Tax=Riccia fluitans TaxID=41844 RepID=A0ABD1Z460_9MARC